MRILVANNQLEKTGGTENYVYAMIVELLRLGHEVEYFTFFRGEISQRIESLGIKFMSRQQYDLILANHNTCVRHLFDKGFIIQTIHGTLPGLESPSCFSDYYVSISKRVQDCLMEENYASKIILNGIDCKRFYPRSMIHEKPMKILSLCQAQKASLMIKECCEDMAIEYIEKNKSVDDEWDIENCINQADLVVGIGRSLYDAMACGRCVLSYDLRDEKNRYEGDGYITGKNIEYSIKYNMTGRMSLKHYSKEGIKDEIRKYNKNDGDFMREYALRNLNIEKNIQEYINLYKEEDMKGQYKILKMIKNGCYNEMQNVEKEHQKSLENSRAWRLVKTLKRFKRLLTR